MKLSKRIVALLVALMLVVGIFAMTASAMYSGYCSKCGKSATIYTMSDVSRSSRVESCSNYGSVHNHISYYSREQVSCPGCGIYNRENFKYTTCPYA